MIDRPIHSSQIKGDSFEAKNKKAKKEGLTHVIYYSFLNNEYAYYCRTLGGAIKCKSDIISTVDKANIKEL